MPQCTTNVLRRNCSTRCRPAGEGRRPLAYLRHLPSLPFLQGAAAGVDHHHQEYVGVFTRGALGRTVERMPGAIRGIGLATTVARGTTTTVPASAGTGDQKQHQRCELLHLTPLITHTFPARPIKHVAMLRGSLNALIRAYL